MNKFTIVTLLGASLLLSACGGKASEVVEQPIAPVAIVEEAVQLPEEPVQEPVQEVAQAPAAPSTGGMMDHWAPASLFRLQVPAGWSMQEDAQIIDNSTVQTFTAPDGNAFVQVLTNKVNDSLDHVLKGQVTLDYMKRLYGEDLRVASDVLLTDGREKLAWWSDENKTSGTTYFDMGNDYLYFYTVASNDKFEDDYASVLEEVADSYFLE